jgi:hypothetical protein
MIVVTVQWNRWYISDAVSLLIIEVGTKIRAKGGGLRRALNEKALSCILYRTEPTATVQAFRRDNWSAVLATMEKRHK